MVWREANSFFSLVQPWTEMRVFGRAFHPSSRFLVASFFDAASFQGRFAGWLLPRGHTHHLQVCRGVVAPCPQVSTGNASVAVQFDNRGPMGGGAKGLGTVEGSCAVVFHQRVCVLCASGDRVSSRSRDGSNTLARDGGLSAAAERSQQFEAAEPRCARRPARPTLGRLRQSSVVQGDSAAR